MLVYGDSERIEKAGVLLSELDASLARLAGMAPGLDRHASLVAAFIQASELAQGLADSEFEERGCDLRSPVHDSCMDLLFGLARAVDVSWRDGFGGDVRVTFGPLWDVVDECARLRVRRPEGYAFYALYPESYLEAARRSGLGSKTHIIGIRSIGLGLAALVAAALDAPPPVSVRPVGHPYRRELRVGGPLEAEVRASSAEAFAIVDEGPGLSGSSFGAVADWLETAGISRERIHFFPSHGGGLGPQASPPHADRWRSAPRHLVSTDDLLLGQVSGRRRLESWIAGAVGPLDGPLEDVSGGAWRRRRYDDERHWPASNTAQERRKFMARAGGGTWLAKFIGLGANGTRKLQLAQRLHQAGFGAEPVGLCHGFLVERWIENAPSLDQVEVGRDRLVDGLAAYLGFRARELSAPEDGTTLSELSVMARHNVGEALDHAAGQTIGRLLNDADTLQRRVHRVRTDNRMHRHEWLSAGGGLLKTDALDHSEAHDLVGCQDIAWDVAGATVEFALGEAEVARFCAGIADASGRPVDRKLLAFLLPCYLAFQMGACLMAVPNVDPEEARRLEASAERYRSRILALLRHPALP